MKPRDLLDLTLLAALWGGSFLFMRYAVPDFGVVPLIWLRVALASICLLPLLLMKGQLGALRERAGAVAVMGLFNSGLPFLLIAWATLSITAGLASIMNAMTPVCTAVIGAIWLGDRLDGRRSLGLLLGLAGVALLAADKADFRPGGSGWAIVAMLLATACYGFAANHTRRYLQGVPALVNATGTQLVSALVLLPPALWSWPERMPGLGPWLAALVLGVACSALAYLLFFRLIARVGASRAVTVTFLVPVFGTLWGALFLGEPVTASMLAGGAVVLLGTGLATGVIGGQRSP
ncbi:drug/metabolite transporter (DMT)-like permease [Sphaerotilus sulfidivorans]|uniref:DMT family transporter n=1 Tax=Sphaerotilus sulfidivorans TaxID=639200 RepID=A0A5C1Q6F4_9BURK|nr:DMT family transporter [Sphaerotilus sulfidivorans]NZD45094.1 DMT family transporter [Sphaerotilus sulfidivorans]QEN02406.1 DMT family transporter [Sphaerotilus sulfidivorans]